jgi:hypothetical protein
MFAPLSLPPQLDIDHSSIHTSRLHNLCTTLTFQIALHQFHGFLSLVCVQEDGTQTYVCSAPALAAVQNSISLLYIPPAFTTFLVCLNPKMESINSMAASLSSLLNITWFTKQCSLFSYFKGYIMDFMSPPLEYIQLLKRVFCLKTDVEKKHDFSSFCRQCICCVFLQTMFSPCIAISI